MSNSRGQAGGRGSGKYDHTRLHLQKQPALIHRDSKYSKGDGFSTWLGNGLAVMVVHGIVLRSSIGHGNSTVDASGTTTGVAPADGSLNHPKGRCGNAG